MPSSECEKIDDKIDQAPKTDSYHTTEKRWSRVLLPGPDSPPVSPNNEAAFDTVTVNTELEAPTVKYQEQGIQCDFEEQEEKEKKLQTPKEESLPTGSRLAILLLCACTAIFPSSTGESIRYRVRSPWKNNQSRRTRLLLPQPLLASPNTSTPSKTSIVALSIFELGSLRFASSPNSTALIVGRAIAGLGSAGIFSGSFITITCSVPLVKRAKYGTYLGNVYAIASIYGPLLEGAFTDHLTCRWHFYINLPLGAVVILEFTKLDGIGTVLFTGATSCIFVALQWGGVKYGWFSGRIVLLLFAFALTGIGWIFIQYRRGENATLPGSIAKMRSIAAGAIYSFLMGASFYFLLYYVAVWFQAVKGGAPCRPAYPRYQ